MIKLLTTLLVINLIVLGFLLPAHFNSLVVEAQPTQPVELVSPPPRIDDKPDGYKSYLCYWIAYDNFLKRDGAILVWGTYPLGEHAWIEHDGKTIDGNMTYDGIPSNYKVAVKTTDGDAWLWAMDKWEQNLGIGVDNLGTWVAEDGDTYKPKDIIL